MSYTILSVAYPLTPVGPDATGGSEQILTLLDRQLTATGHRSLVIAVEGSQVKGELIPSPRSSGGLNDDVRRWGQRAHGRLLLETLNRYPVDLVHMHSLDFHAYLPTSSIPTLATLHLPVDWYPQQIFLSQRKNFFLNCVSSSQHDSCAPPSNNLMPFVRNGIDVDSFHWKVPKQQFVLSLGRICPEKGFHLALDAAKEAGISLVLAGEVFPYSQHLSYFEREILPRLDDKRRYVGPAGAQMKRQLLAEASALLVPSLVAETCSLVTMEALASGTPVIAFRAGAIPELVEDGKTGFLVNGMEEMADAIRRISLLKPKDCREAAEERCDARRMVRNYMSLYRKMLMPVRERKPRPVQAGLSWLVDVP
jgi:glycosyltransferase involved in cell wall biosynthesis